MIKSRNGDVDKAGLQKLFENSKWRAELEKTNKSLSQSWSLSQDTGPGQVGSDNCGPQAVMTILIDAFDLPAANLGVQDLEALRMWMWMFLEMSRKRFSPQIVEAPESLPEDPIEPRTIPLIQVYINVYI
jgi:hypothetical protein